MRAYALLGLLIAAPALAQAPATPASADRTPQEAAKAAASACADHSKGTIAIEGKSKELDAEGLKYQLNAPDFLAATKSNNLGIAEYAKSPSSQGEIWAIGYDSGACMVVALGVPVADVEKGFADYFSQGKIWRKEQPLNSPKAGERVVNYVSNPRRNLKLTASISMRDADNQAIITLTRGFVS